MKVSLLFTGVLTSLVCISLNAQRIYESDLPQQLSDLEEWQSLQKRKKEEMTAFRQAVVSALPERAVGNTVFYLDLALKELDEYGITAFQQRIRQLASRKTELEEVIEKPLRILESRLGEVEEALGLWNRLYAFSGDQMALYKIDTALLSIQSELAFYNFRDGEKIGEIGAGDESFAAVVGVSSEKIIYYLNDVLPESLDRIAYHINFNPIFDRNENEFFPILGSSSSTGLEGMALDKVLIRNAVHHFDRLEEMLLAVKESMREDGWLFVKEMYQPDCRNHCCNELKSAAQLLPVFEKVGFQLSESQLLEEFDGDWHLLKFSIRKGS